MLYRSSLVVAEWDADCTRIPSSLPTKLMVQLQNCMRFASKLRQIWRLYGDPILLATVPGLMKAHWLF